MTDYADIKYVSTGGGGTTAYANLAAFPSSGNSTGDLGFAEDTDALYIWDGAAWTRIDNGDESPVILTEPSSTHTLQSDGSTSTVTMVAEDPEGFDITYGIAYKTTDNALPDQLASATSINQSTGVYTFTPSTTQADEGSFRARLSASDGAKTTTRFVDVSLGFNVPGELLLIAGGGGGNSDSGGGGGAGGYVEDSNYPFSKGTTYDITVGTGGAYQNDQAIIASNGGDSTFSSNSSNIYVATGGGGGGSLTASASGGSGGGAGRGSSVGGGASTQASYDGKGFGYAGGNMLSPNTAAGGGGGAGGAGGDGYNSISNYGGTGGAAKSSSITGTATYYAGGGPGGGYNSIQGSYGTGGGSSVIGNGGIGGIWSSATDGTNGVDGVVIIATQQAANTVTGAYTLDTAGRTGYYVYTFTGTGSITF